jgi:hypothetical protein
MKTVLPSSIQTVAEAKEFLTALYDNNEVYHPEDNAFDIDWKTTTVSHEEAEQLNKLMDDIYKLKDEFDACEFLLELEANDLGDDPQDARNLDKY